MIYEGMKIIGRITKSLKDCTKKYIICVKSSQFWVIYDETNSYWRVKDITNELEYSGNECIIIRNKKGNLK